MEAVAAGTVASIGVAGLARRWFRAAVQDAVDNSVADMIRQQAEFGRQVNAHLNRQDARLKRIEARITRHHPGG